MVENSRATGAPGSAAIAAGSRATARAGAAILAAGGNAVDAVVATTLAGTVAEQAMTSLGGGGFLVVRTPDGQVELRDFFVDTPGRGLPPERLDLHFVPIDVSFPGRVVQRFFLGLGSVAVPGALTGLLAAHEEFCRLPLARLAAPAREYAAHGVVMEPAQEAMGELIKEMVALTPESRSLIEREGRWLAAGDNIVNPRLAAFLDRLIAGDVTSLTSAPIAEPLLEVMSDGGLITAADLAGYRVIEREPLSVHRLGWQVLTNPPPSFGGLIIADTLRDAPTIDPRDARSWCELLEALTSATAHRRSTSLTPLTSTGTTHVSAVDRDGMVAGMTTSNGEASGFVIPGTGIQLNNMLGEADLHPDGFHASPPGQRMGSMMSPTLLVAPDGSVVVLGSGGSERIRSSLTEVIVRLVDAGQGLDRAIADPRIHPNADGLQVEPQLGTQLASDLRACWPGVVNVWPDTSVYFGGVNAVQLHSDRSVTAVADGRRGGCAIVLPQR